MILWLLACAEVPAPCLPMCEAATAARGACLAEQGLDWSAAGYSDAAEHQSACETWAWEMRLLERDAGCPGATASVCAARDEALRAADSPCPAYDAIDWSSSPIAWQACDG